MAVFRLMMGMLVVGVMSMASAAQAAATVDCDTVIGIDKNEAFKKAEQKDVQACMLRGYDPPTGWKRDDGKSAGVRASGGGGFSYGVVQAPETPPAKYNVNASVSSGVMKATCSFPPRSLADLSKPGSCYQFLNNLLKDKSGASSTTTPTPLGTGPCPTENENTGIFGVKQITSAGGSTLRTCGAMLPTTTYDLVMNKNPTNLFTTETGGYNMWVYKKSGSTFNTIVNGGGLTRCLAQMYSDSDGNTYWEKVADITPPMAQMITYSPGSGTISIRLMPRETMTAGYIPPYNDSDPVLWLVLPLDGNGVPQVPAEYITTSGESCADVNSNVWRLPDNNQEIALFSATTSGCEGVTALPAYAGGVPPAAVCAPGTTSPAPDASCDIVTVYPKGTFGPTVCDGKTQYTVLNRPSLYYPPNTTSTLMKIQGRTALMANVVANSMLFMQSQATISFAPTETSPVTLNEGGFLKMANGSQLIMSPPVTITPSTYTIQMTQGGQLVSSGGTRITGFNAGATYVIPAALRLTPMQIRVGRSITLPAGYMIPTMPAMTGDPSTPYIRLPVDKPPA